MNKPNQNSDNNSEQQPEFSEESVDLAIEDLVAGMTELSNLMTVFQTVNKELEQNGHINLELYKECREKIDNFKQTAFGKDMIKEFDFLNQFIHILENQAQSSTEIPS